MTAGNRIQALGSQVQPRWTPTQASGTDARAPGSRGACVRELGSGTEVSGPTSIDISPTSMNLGTGARVLSLALINPSKRRCPRPWHGLRTYVGTSSWARAPGSRAQTSRSLLGLNEHEHGHQRPKPGCRGPWPNLNGHWLGCRGPQH